jgi:hypothetical protein
MRITIAAVSVLFSFLISQTATASERTTVASLSAPSLLNFWRPQPPVGPPRTRGVSRSHASTACLPGKLRSAVANVSARFGRVTVISTHRPGARIHSGRPSLHASCQAVDFKPARGAYGRVATYLRTNWDGGVGTYSSGHIHLDVGPRYRWHSSR